MKENYTVYKHIFPNNKIYIGITKRKPEIRWNKGRGYESCPLMNKAIQKYAKGYIWRYADDSAN